MIDLILTKSISRFARNTVTLLVTVRELKSLGVGVFFEEQNLHSLSGDGELMLSILASYAQEESRSTSENCKWRIRKDFKEGKTYLDRHRKSSERVDELESIRSERISKAKMIDRFIRDIGSRPLALTAFDEKLWLAVIDIATVSRDGNITFKFRNGSEITE